MGVEPTEALRERAELHGRQRAEQLLVRARARAWARGRVRLGLGVGVGLGWVTVG